MKQNLILPTVLPTAISAFSAEYYVNASRPDDSGTAMNWATAKQTIQAAVDLATDDDTVWVTNGVYDAGRAIAPIRYEGDPANLLTNRICITKAITVRSVNGADVTVIQGASDNGTNGPAAVRCAYLVSGAILEGFTLTGGYTFPDGENRADSSGGGAFLSGNTTMLNNCRLSGNHAGGSGGGAFCSSKSAINNCLFIGNFANSSGGGAYVEYDGVLNNCVLSGNTANNYSGGALVYYGMLNNCIVWGNTAELGYPNLYADCLVHYTCSSPRPEPIWEDEGNICADPLFVDAVNSNFQLQAGSPCLNAGNNSYVSTNSDLDGNPRIVGGVVDMGAYENQTAGSDADNAGMDDLWELNRFGGRHFADPETICSNGLNTLRQVYIAGLDPHNPQSRFLATGSQEGVLKWPCVSGRVYSVWFSTNLLNGFQPWVTNIPWTAGAFTDNVHNADGQGFYKIGVELE